MGESGVGGVGGGGEGDDRSGEATRSGTAEGVGDRREGPAA